MKKDKKENTVFDFRTIKTFEDACEKMNLNPLFLPYVSMIPEGLRTPIIIQYKLFIIFQAINDGWEPNWGDWKEMKYYPWFEIKSSGSGFAFADSDYDSTGAHSCVGSRLCTNSSEKAIYIAKTFEKEYIELFLIQK
jgi:hypothetical protein